MPALLKKWTWEEEQRYEEAFILNITKEKNYVLKYFDSLITDHESYSKQVVLITICLWMTILNRKDFFKTENGQRSLSNRIFTAFQVFTTKSEPILSKNDRQNKKLYGIPADEDDVNSACNVNENDVMSMFIYILSTCSLFTYFLHCLNCITQKFQIICYMLSALYLKYYIEHTDTEEGRQENLEEAKQLFEQLFLI